MKNFDILFIHPPRVLNTNNKRANFKRGEYIFIPMGIFAIADFLEREGFGVKIVNYPFEKYLNRHWDLSEYLKTIDFKACAIDLHWIHNAHGAIEVAKIVKKIKPHVKVILGGFSASYYHDQILKYYNVIDGIIRGEGEVPLLEFIKKINKNLPLDSVPNLTYRNSSKHIKVNSLSYIAKSLDTLNFSNLSSLLNAKKYVESSRKIMGISYNLPIGRGCPYNCPYCGGGQRAQQRNSGRNKVLLRTPKKVVEDISYLLSKYKIESLFFGHGTYPASLKYWKRLFGLIQKENFEISGDLEIWRLPFPKEMWKIFHKTFTRRYSSISISPRTLSSRVHQKIAKVCDPTFHFPKSQINTLIKNANLYQIPLRIWLTIGFPFQKHIDVLKDFNFGVKCLLKYGTSNFKPITIMTEPYHIFPGSPAHESPETFGIKLNYKSFLEIAEAFKRAKISFFYNVVNYDTENFSKVSIKHANMLLFLATAPMFLTTGSKNSKIREKR